LGGQGELSWSMFIIGPQVDGLTPMGSELIE
jgi:hypothetical protein